MRKLTKEEFEDMHFNEIAKHHEMKEIDFIFEVYPAHKVMSDKSPFYGEYEDWYKRTHNKLARALK